MARTTLYEKLARVTSAAEDARMREQTRIHVEWQEAQNRKDAARREWLGAQYAPAIEVGTRILRAPAGITPWKNEPRQPEPYEMRTERSQTAWSQRSVLGVGHP